MKLYATVSSERASKGQGGNEWLEIRITVGSADDPYILARLTARPTETGYGLYDHEDTLLAEVKGNKQKGEPRNFALEHIEDADLPQD